MKNIKSFINRIISEEFEKRSNDLSKKMSDWYEVETNEGLRGNQKKLDIAKPKGKLTAADFKALRNKSKHETKEGLRGNQKKLDVAKPKGKLTAADFKALRDKKKPTKTNESELQYEIKLYDKYGLKTVTMNESSVIELIYSVIKESEKNNISKKEPIGLKKTNSVLNTSKKENNDYLKDVTSKMSKYSKLGSNGTYDSNPKDFPMGNGQISKMKKKAYTPSDAVTEYIENFAYPGMENLNYDEIKPNEDWLSDNIKGTSKTGNNPKWANAVETDLGEKINKKRKANLYGLEKQKSYKKATQPVDEAGEGEGEKSLDKMFMKLESKTIKTDVIIAEEMLKMKNLIGYNRKTQ
jgi:hypothetical protein